MDYGKKTTVALQFIFYLKQNSFFIPSFQRNSHLFLAASLLFVLSFVADAYWSGNNKLSAVANKTEAYLQTAEADFQRLQSDSLLVNNAIAGSLSLDDVNRLMAENYFTFFYKNTGEGSPVLQFWNNRYILPDSTMVQTRQTAGFRQMANGYYVWLKTQHTKGISIALIPVQWNYIISNDYLHNNLVVLEKEKEVLFDVVAGMGARANIKLAGGQNLFYIVERPATFFSQNTLFSILCRLLAVGLLLFLLHRVVSGWVATKGLLLGSAGLILVLLLSRLAVYLFNFPLNLRQFELFNPAVYGANTVLK